MYLKIHMKTKFRELHFRRRSTLHKIGEFYLSDHSRQPQFGQNSILARSKAKIRNWKIINCFLVQSALLGRLWGLPAAKELSRYGAMALWPYGAKV